MDLVAGAVAFYFIVGALLWSLVAGLAGGFAYRKSGNLAIAAIAGILPVALVWTAIEIAGRWPDPPKATVINGKTYTAKTLPAPTLNIPRDLPPDDPKRFDLLQSFGIDGSEIELCRKQGCRVVFTAQGGISSVGPVMAGDWQYTLDPATEKWKLKE